MAGWPTKREKQWRERAQLAELRLAVLAGNPSRMAAWANGTDGKSLQDTADELIAELK